MFSQQLIDDLINPGNTNIVPGLERMHTILELLDNPQHKYKTIHITGTNGKGSTAAFLETGLLHAGYKVGKFTSPHIHKINECIALNQSDISDQDLELSYFKIKNLLEQNNFELSPFEFLTAIMFDYFASMQIEWLILEVGMGGAHDSTNVVDSCYSIITNVTLEHTKWLGNTIAEIATEKSGIIKKGLTIIADKQRELIQVVEGKTKNYINVLDEFKINIELDIQNFLTHLTFSETEALTGEHVQKKISASKSYSLHLFGKFQAYNFLCAYTVFKDLELPERSIEYAAENTKWAGRLQAVQTAPAIILDATHNVAGSLSLLDSLKDLYNKDEVIIITSILRDKDVTMMLNNFSKLSNQIIYTSISSNPRGMQAHEIKAYAGSIFESSHCIDEPLLALEYAKSLNKKLILITGSLYLLSYFN